MYLSTSFMLPLQTRTFYDDGLCRETSVKAHIEHTVSRRAKNYSLLQMKGFTMATVLRCPVRFVYQHPLISNQWSTIHSLDSLWYLAS